MGPISPNRLVVIEQHPVYSGELVFQVFEGESAFYSRYRDFVRCYLVLNELFNLPAFIDRLCRDGWEPIFGPSAEPIGLPEMSLVGRQLWAQSGVEADRHPDRDPLRPL